MNRLPIAKRAQILTLLCEGSSMRSISRIVDCAINTVTRELVLAGKACAALHDQVVRNVKSQRVQCDEIWSFVAMKEKTAKRKKTKRPAAVGDAWTWTGIDADSKLILAWLVGGRDAGYAFEFMTDLAARLANRVQLTTDGHKAYLSAVEGAFGLEVDYAMLIKEYGPDPQDDAHRYSPPQCIGVEVERITGFPDKKHISTSYVERSNLSMRMHMRRFTRLTNAFSKKFENHCHMIALYSAWFNFCRIYMTLRVTPAMEAKVALPDGKEGRLTNRQWTMEDIVNAVDEWETAQPKEEAVQGQTE